MLSSNSFNHNPIPNFKPFAENDISFSTSKLDQDPYNSSFLFSLPNSPLMHLEYQDAYLQFLELFYQDHHQSITTSDANPEITAMAADSNENEVLVKDQDAAVSNGKATSTTMSKANHQTGRCSKKDRHSKINTARGPRDRRMRLSLDIARKFFDLQDLLGYDKASRTVDWLLRNSRPAIRELARGRAGTQINHPSSDQSSTCEEADCEVVSSTAEEAAPSSVAPFSCTKVKRSKKVKRVESRAISVVARESRRKARERARERTSQKRRLIVSEEAKIFGDQSLVNFSQESHVHIYGVQAAAAGRAEDYLSSDEAARIQQVCTAPWNPSTVFDYEEDNNAAFLHQDEQIAEFQLISGKPWEALNSFNLSG